MSRLLENRYTALLGTLVVLLLVSPLIDDEGAGGVLLSALFTLVLVACAVVIGRGRRQLVVLLAFAVPWVYLTWLHPAWSDDPLDVFASILLAIGTVYVAVVLLVEVVKAETVNRDVIAGAIAVYLLVGIAWAVAYALIEGLTPGAFNLGAAEQGTIWNKLLYFSFTTLTTLGFGDISPASPVARIWTVFEAVCGTFFLAVLISRLVGLYKGS
ncbi:MAG: potassium channel family protein [Alphaproteobacteria bacterium]|nr:potassium channel family protein [Alphaproteobacteria bacterium]